MRSRPLPTQAKTLDKRANSTRFTFQFKAGGELPVELVSVNATARGQRTSLTWETASETENAGFEIQHRKGGRFRRVAFVEGAGTTEDPQRYRHRTEKLPVGTHVFRIVQRDTDGTAQVSETVEVDVELEGRSVLRAPYPNPFRQTATVEFAVKGSQTVTLVLYNTLGQRVRTLCREPSPRNQMQRVQIEDRDLASGVYFIRMLGETITATR